MIEKKLGFYQEYRGKQFISLKEVVSHPIREEDLNPDILNYLNNGIRLSSYRTWFLCPVFEEYISGPSIYTDGEWFWTSEYIFYLERFIIPIPDLFLKKMQKNNFKVLSTEQFGLSNVLNLEKEILKYVAIHQ